MAFIVFEGLDGSGKSTLINGLSESLGQKGVSYHVTREPGGTPLGDEIREILIRKTGDTPSPRTELLLYEAIRAQHVDRNIRPRLEKGEWVLCDRYSASSVAFQAGGRSLNGEAIEWLNDFATDRCYPDLWVLLDLTTDESSRRMEQRSKNLDQELDRFEAEKREFHERVRQCYLKLAANEKNWLVLDATLSPEELLKNLLKELEQRGWL